MTWARPTITSTVTTITITNIRRESRARSTDSSFPGIHARTDGLISLAVVIGVIGVWLDLPWADPVIGVIISLAIFVLLITTAKDIGQRLLDGADPQLTETPEDAIRGLPTVFDVTELRLRWNGHRLNLHANIIATDAETVDDFKVLQRTVETSIRDALPGVGDVIVTPAPSAVP